MQVLSPGYGRRYRCGIATIPKTLGVNERRKSRFGQPPGAMGELRGARGNVAGNPWGLRHQEIWHRSSPAKMRRSQTMPAVTVEHRMAAFRLSC